MHGTVHLHLRPYDTAVWGDAPLLVDFVGGIALFTQNQVLMNLQPSSFPPFQENASSQELHIELVRHYADVLRMLTERIVPVFAVPAPELSSAVEPDPVFLQN